MDLSGKKIKVIYGGSVNSENVMEYVIDSSIDGVLIGGASADKQKSAKIIDKIRNI